MPEFIEIATGEPVEVEVPLADARTTPLEANAATSTARLFFRVLRREIGSDGGVSLELHGSLVGERTELLRFDVFRDDPHFHIPATRAEPSGHLERSEHTEHEQLLANVIERAALELGDWLTEAGQPELAAALGEPPYPAASEGLRNAVAAAPEPAKKIRVELTPAVRRAVGL